MSYWERYVQKRSSRRRVLAATSATAAGAVLLVACGDDEDDSGSTGGGGATGGGSTGTTGASASTGGTGATGGTSASGGLVHTPVDTTSQARVGGNLSTGGGSIPENATFDVAAARSSPEAGPGNTAYPGLLKFKAAKYPDTPQGELEGEVAESWEVSGDRLQVTMKLRRGLKWDPREPTSGREIDAQDVLATWERFAQLSAFGGAFAYSESTPDAPIESIEAPDAETLVFNLVRPNSSLLPLLAITNSIRVMPIEAANGGFDPVLEPRGYGPFLLDQHESAVRFVWRRNPEYHVQGRPFIETWEETILPEYSSQLAQFRAGNIYMNVVDRLEDVLPTKQDIPELLLTQDHNFDLSSHAHVVFGYEGEHGVPFLDQRVRQAVSMLINREEYIDLMTQRDAFAAEGIDVNFRMPSPLPAGFEGFWVDPTNEAEFGPTARFVNYNPEEARKLIEAAGYGDGLTTPLLLSARHAEIYPYADLTAIVQQHLAQGGINAEPQQIDYTNDFLPNVFGGYTGGSRSGFSGMATRRIAPSPFAGQHMFDLMHPGGRAFVGAPVNGGHAADGDPEITDLINQYFLEFELETQQEIAKDYQRLVAEKANIIQTQIYFANWYLDWPVIGNHAVYRALGERDSPPGDTTREILIHLWIDDSKPPLA